MPRATQPRARRATSDPLTGRTVVVGVSGGIAAYKACELVRALKTRGAAVIVVMTPAAAEFVTATDLPDAVRQPGRARPVGRPGAEASSCPTRPRACVRGKVEHVDVAEAADAHRHRSCHRRPHRAAWCTARRPTR